MSTETELMFEVGELEQIERDAHKRHQAGECTEEEIEDMLRGLDDLIASYPDLPAKAIDHRDIVEHLEKAVKLSSALHDPALTRLVRRALTHIQQS